MTKIILFKDRPLSFTSLGLVTDPKVGDWHIQYESKSVWWVDEVTYVDEDRYQTLTMMDYEDLNPNDIDNEFKVGVHNIHKIDKEVFLDQDFLRMRAVYEELNG